jgi:hypothetical protein
VNEAKGDTAFATLRDRVGFDLVALRGFTSAFFTVNWRDEEFEQAGF